MLYMLLVSCIKTIANFQDINLTVGALFTQVPVEFIQKLTNSTPADMRKLACSIMTGLETGRTKFY